MRKRTSGLLQAVALAIFAILFFAQTFNVRNFPGTRFGAEVWPRAITVCLAVLAIILLVQNLRRTAEPDDGVARGSWLAREWIPVAVFACFFSFLWLVPRFGAYPSGGLFVFALLSILGPKTPRAVGQHFAISVGVTIVLWLIFAHVLHVIAPSGRWWP